jgi:hypothetical protein
MTSKFFTLEAVPGCSGVGRPHPQQMPWRGALFALSAAFLKCERHMRKPRVSICGPVLALAGPNGTGWSTIAWWCVEKRRRGIPRRHKAPAPGGPLLV